MRATFDLILGTEARHGIAVEMCIDDHSWGGTRVCPGERCMRTCRTAVRCVIFIEQE